LFVLIFWGAYVRFTGSGLSISEWPVVNGSLLPPSLFGRGNSVFDNGAYIRGSLGFRKYQISTGKNERFGQRVFLLFDCLPVYEFSCVDN
jgi:hypothetical protein